MLTPRWYFNTFEQMLLTFDNGQSAPLDLLPAAVDEPLVDLLHQLCQVVRVRLHDLVKLCKLDRGERNMVRAEEKLKDVKKTPDGSI